MNSLFISHNSMDKVKAYRLKRALSDEEDTEVWLDSNEIAYGEVISDAILDGIKKATAILIIWTKNAASSKGVEHEIAHAIKLEKKLYFLLFDDTPPPPLKGDFGFLGIEFQDFHVGLANLIGSLVQDEYRLMHEKSDELDTLFSEQLEAGKMAEHFSRERISNSTPDAEKIPMLQHILEMCREQKSYGIEKSGAYYYIRNNLRKVKYNNPESLKTLYQELITGRQADNKFVKELFIPTIQQLMYTEVSYDTEALQDYLHEINTTFNNNEPMINHWLSSAFPGQNTALLNQEMRYYFSSAINVLEKLIQETPQSDAIREMRQRLYQYLLDPNDIIPETPENGIWGYSDDVYIIINTVYRSIEAGILADSFQLDWQAITRGDQILLAIFDDSVKPLIDNHLVETIEILGILHILPK